ncbi:hypothetical protein Rhopal_004448-T1 [Rhodotorula paludigena]|uniref:Uncharacterized protein n=1 Tax=Rhodotorula paludigena TaxID=86838 RepID=A0AAV5GPK4_9BASI|nr:hypothetical protein Rhopal_004448-T1 [Rhodotorula paludigena]
MRNWFTCSVKDSDFWVMILLERRLNRLAAEEADHIASRQGLACAIGCGHIGGELFVASQRELVERKNNKKGMGKGHAKTFNLKDNNVSPNNSNSALARAYGETDGKDVEPNRTKNGTLLLKQMAYVCGFNVYLGPAMVMKHAKEEKRATVHQYKHKTAQDPLLPSGASACGNDSEGKASANKKLDVETALSRVLGKILGKLETTLKDKYALCLIASALFKLYAPIVVNSHPSLSAALARLTRAKHNAELGHFGLKLSKIIAFTSVLAFLLPTAGYSVFIADCFTHQLCGLAPLQRLQSIIQLVALDLQAAGLKHQCQVLHD